MNERSQRHQQVDDIIRRYVADNDDVPDVSVITSTLGVSNQEARQCLEEYLCVGKFVEMAGLGSLSLARGDDPPDYLLNGRTGLEITTYHEPTQNGLVPRRVIEAAWERLQREFWRESVNHDAGAGVRVRFMFSRLEVPSNPTEQSAFVKEAFTLISAVSQQITRRVRARIDAATYPMLTRYLDDIHLDVLIPPLKWMFDWNHNIGGGISEDELIAALEPKLADSRPSGIEAYWLLVVTGFRISEMAVLGPFAVDDLSRMERLSAGFSTGPYDRVYVMTAPSRPVPILNEITAQIMPGWSPPPPPPVYVWDRIDRGWSSLAADAVE